MLTRDSILKASDYEKEEVNVPEWGGSIFIRSMSARVRDEMQIRFMKMRGNDGAGSNGAAWADFDQLRGLQVALVSYCLCDETGKLLFDDDEGRSILAEKSGAVIDRLYDVAMRINNLSPEAEENQKNGSPPTLSTASSSSLR